MIQDDSTSEAVSNDTFGVSVGSVQADQNIPPSLEATNGVDHSADDVPQEASPDGVILDINDPRLNEQVEDYDPLADANMFTPAPDGAHLAIIGFSDKPGQSYFVGNILYCLLEATIDEPGQPWT